MGVVSHCVIEVSIKQVHNPSISQGAFSRGPATVEAVSERTVEDLTKIITRAANVNAAIDKVKRLLDAELDTMMEVNSDG